MTGAKGYQIYEPTNSEYRRECRGQCLLLIRTVFEEAVASSGLYRPILGNALTGWTPKKPSFVDGVDLYYTAYLASLGEED